MSSISSRFWAPIYFATRYFGPPVNAANDRTLQVADALTGLIAAAWGPLSPDSIQRVYQAEVEDLETGGFAAIAGRQVYVFPVNTAMPRMLTRTSYLREHMISVVVAERYTAQDVPPDAWMDARVTFTTGTCWLPYAPENVVPPILPAMTLSGVPIFCKASDVELYSLDQLIAQKLFLGVVNFTFQEEVSTI